MVLYESDYQRPINVTKVHAFTHCWMDVSVNNFTKRISLCEAIALLYLKPFTVLVM